MGRVPWGVLPSFRLRSIPVARRLICITYKYLHHIREYMYYIYIYVVRSTSRA